MKKYVYRESNCGHKLAAALMGCKEVCRKEMQKLWGQKEEETEHIFKIP